LGLFRGDKPTYSPRVNPANFEPNLAATAMKSTDAMPVFAPMAASGMLRPSNYLEKTYGAQKREERKSFIATKKIREGFPAARAVPRKGFDVDQLDR
jgi:hypothetical protein